MHLSYSAMLLQRCCFSDVGTAMLLQRCGFSDVASAMLAQLSRLSLLVIFVIHPFLTGKTEDRKDRNY